MAPVEPVTSNSDLVPVVTSASVAILFGASLYQVLHSLFALQRALPVSQRTRAHDLTRRKDVMLFAALAVLSLAVHLYNLAEVLLDSYNTYVIANKVDTKIDIWSSPLWFPREDRQKDSHLGAWWASGLLEKTAYALIESPRDFWWLQQEQVAAILWVLFVAIEGRRRNIPNIWAYILLGVLSNLSLPTNIFFIALLLSPVPYSHPTHALHSAVQKLLSNIGLTTPTNRPHTWTPHTLIHALPLITSTLSTAFFSSLPHYLWSLRALACLIPMLSEHSALLPCSLGKTHHTIHAAHASYKPVFRLAALLALALHVHSTYTAMYANTPSPPPRFRLFNMTAEEHPESITARYRQGISRVLGALSDSPLAQLIGWDVILTGLSLCAWAGTRALEPTRMLAAIGLPVNSKTPHEIKEVAKGARKSAAKTGERVEKAARGAAARAGSLANGRTPGGGHTLRDGRSWTDYPEDAQGASPRRGRGSKQVARAGGSVGRVERDRGGDGGDGGDGGEGGDAKADATYRSHDEKALRAVEHEEERGAVGSGEGAESAAVAWGILVLGGLGGGMCAVGGGEVL